MTFMKMALLLCDWMKNKHNGTIHYLYVNVLK